MSRILRRLSGTNVGLTTEDGRSFYQQRIALYGLLGFAIIGIFVLSSMALFALDARLTVTEWLTNPHRLWDYAGIALFGLLWLVARGGRRALPLLLACDGAVTIGYCALFLFGAGNVEMPLAPAFATLCLTNVLLLRAVVVPSAALRTFAIGALATAATIGLQAAGTGTRVLATVSSEEDLARQRIILALFAIAALALSTIVSRVLWGLRRQVDEALQLGQYRLEEKLGEGGMGEVYRARHAMLRRPTAVKLLRGDAVDEDSLASFEREVQLTAGLSHPNTISVYDYGRTAEGVFYYAMEYLDGLDLGELVRETGPLPPGRVVHFLRQACGSLAEAHEIGLIHRDVKPGNLMVTHRGGQADVLKVLDFGLVAKVESLKDEGRGFIRGTPQYLAPESISDPDKVGPQVDVYGLGCVAWFLLVGRPPFESDTLAGILHLHASKVPSAPSRALGREVPADLERIVMRCLEKDPSLRPPGAAALGSELEACSVAGSWTALDARAWWSGRTLARASLAAPDEASESTLRIDPSLRP